MSQTLNANKLKFLTHSIENITKGLELNLLTPKDAIERLNYETNELKKELGVNDADESDKTS